jgi:alkanesulfonate monooxygenase SsuD/methylene tetrahydromethanopterin reductase-like flavin-dependent oxidoreductase (luciferase family)
MTIQFGFCLPIFAWPGGRLFRTPAYAQLDAITTMRLGKLAEDLGYHSLWVADHLMLGKDEAILEGWTTLSALAGMTQRVRLGMIHNNNAFRHPSMTAKMVATLDQISGGRMIHFVDYGNRPREFIAYDLHGDDAMEERIAQMCEGIELALQLWTSDAPVNFTGKHYRTIGAVCAPKPLQQPHPPIWIGEAHPDLLAATAHYAQGWNTTPVSIAELQRRLRSLNQACQRASRDFDAIEKSLEIQVLIAPDHAGLRDKLRAMLALAPSESPDTALQVYVSGATNELPDFMRESWLVGTSDDVVQRVREYVAEGIRHFLLWFADAPDADGMRLFADEVMPHIGAK